MNKKFLRYLSSILLLSAPMHMSYAGAPVIEAYDNKPVGNIEITSDSLTAGFDAKAIASRLKTKVGDPFSQLTFDSDLKTLSEDYDRIEPNLEIHNGQVYIQIKVWPRPAIRSMRWEGNKDVKTKTLQKELGIKPKATFNRQKFNKAFNKVKEYYIKNGYFESGLQYTVTQDSKTNEVDIDITVQEGRAGTIEKIAFKGFTDDEKSALLEEIHTKKYNILTSWFLGTGIYNEDALDQDRLTIINFLQNEGYADAKVDIQIKEAESKGKIVLEISCEKGPIFHFGEISMEGNKLFKTDALFKRLGVQKGDVYSPEKLRESAQTVKDIYGRRGYINANVSYEAKLAENAPIYDIHLTIDEGEQYKIGLIHVFGNVQTKAHVILRESLLVPGETFDTEKLKLTQTRLENIGYFKSVNVYAVRTQDDQLLGENYRDVYIEVEETTTGNLSLFGGFSTAEDLFGGLDLTETNFNYKGIPRIFTDGLAAVRGGGEYARARVTLGARQTAYALSWMDPYFRDTLWRIGFDGSFTNSDLQTKNYHIKTIGGSAFASYPINPLWAFGTKYRLRHEMISVNKNTSDLERAQARNSGLVSGVAASINFDSTDSAIKPHNGFRSAIEAEFVGLGGDFTFGRLTYINTLYKSYWRRGVFKLRGDLKFIEPIWKTNTAKKIPLSERFFLGGENSVRGYEPFSLGKNFPGKKDDPQGGISSTLLSLEYMHEVFSFLDLFAFFDAGNIELHKLKIGELNMSYGVGLRTDAINRVPITFGYGVPINPSRDDQVHRFFFAMGGQF